LPSLLPISKQPYRCYRYRYRSAAPLASLLVASASQAGDCSRQASQQQVGVGARFVLVVPIQHKNDSTPERCLEYNQKQVANREADPPPSLLLNKAQSNMTEPLYIQPQNVP
jgi:hypothetical protein